MTEGRKCWECVKNSSAGGFFYKLAPKKRREREQERERERGGGGGGGDAACLFPPVLMATR